mgnify:CR=1 FL=1
MSDDATRILIYAPRAVGPETPVPVGVAALNRSDFPMIIAQCTVKAAYGASEDSFRDESAWDREIVASNQLVDPHDRWCSAIGFAPPSDFAGIVKFEGQISYQVPQTGIRRHVEDLVERLTTSRTDASTSSEREAAPSFGKEVTLPWQLETRVSPVEASIHQDWYAGDFFYSWLSQDGAENGIPTEVAARAGDGLGLSWACPILSCGSQLLTQREQESWDELNTEIEQSSAEVLLVPTREYKPKNSAYSRFVLRTSGQTLNYAAGPFSGQEVESLEVFRRKAGPVDEEDPAMPPLAGLKVWNGYFAEEDVRDQFHWGTNLWTELLLSGERKTLIGGSDGLAELAFREGRPVSRVQLADGKREHAFGTIRTLVHCPQGLSIDNLLNGLKDGRAIVSEGPVASFVLHNELGETASIGGSLQGRRFRVSVRATSTQYCGDFQEVVVRRGDFAEQTEQIELLLMAGVAEDMKSIHFEDDLDIPVGSQGYLRIEAYTKRDDRVFYVFTNPIWITAI